MKHQVILGPPGTGKTRYLIEATIEYLQAPDSGKALFCSHTRAAARTAVERWAQESTSLDISTIHSFCFHELKLSRAQTVDDAKLAEFVKEFGLDMDEGGDGRKYNDTMALAGNVGITLEEAYSRNGSPGTLAHFMAFARSYLKWKDQFGYVDFTDMLQMYVARARQPSPHMFLAIDEAQDLTPLHWKVVAKMMDLNPKLQVIVAGDEDQCIYEYGGAYARGITEFRDQHNARYTQLVQSYRVPRVVHSLAMRVIGRAENRLEVQYAPREGAPGAHIEYAHLSLYKENLLNDSLIVFNDKFIRKDVEERLIEQAVPYEAVSGMPAPLQTRAARAIKLAHCEKALDPEQLNQLKRALNDKGQQVFDSVGPEAVLERLLKGRYEYVNIHWSNREYFARVDWRAPVRVRISTIHGAKGMEADNVHLVTAQSQAAVDYALNNPDAQHRLFYVGVTRARERLFTYEGDNNYDLP